MTGTIYLNVFLIFIICMGTIVFSVSAEDGRIGSSLTHPDAQMVTLHSDTESIEIGDCIHLVGTIDPSLITVSPSDTIILIAPPEGSQCETVVLAPPGQNGTFESCISTDVPGIWEFEALFGGIYSPKVQVTTVPSKQSGRTTLTVSGWPVYPHMGEEVFFKGRLSDASGKGVSDRNVSYEVATYLPGCDLTCMNSNPGTWNFTGYVKTDSAGEYRFPLLMNDSGLLRVRVFFEGDSSYSRSESRIIDVTISDT